MLTRNLVESELSVAYLQAIAAKCKFSIDIPHIDADSIDAVISAKGKILPTSRLNSPRIEIQLKATMNAVANGAGDFPLSLAVKNYDDLRVDTVVPRLLVLYSLPTLEADWLIHHPTKIELQHCAYYLNLLGEPAVAVQHTTVHIPSTNMLTPFALRSMMIRVSMGQRL